MTLLKELHNLAGKTLTEARKPTVSYTIKKVEDSIDKVTASLSGNESGVMTKLSKRYFELDAKVKELKELQEGLNKDIKDLFEDYFDAEDMVATRVIETNQFVMQLSKFTAAENKPDEYVTNYEKVVKEIQAGLLPELNQLLDALIDKNKELKEKKDTVSKLTTKEKDEEKKGKKKVSEEIEMLEEGLLDSILNKLSKFYTSIRSACKMYDKKLSKLKEMME
jgi:archaellum component FlaC